MIMILFDQVGQAQNSIVVKQTRLIDSIDLRNLSESKATYKKIIFIYMKKVMDDKDSKVRY